MRLCLYLDPKRIFRWHGWLAHALAAIPGCDLVCLFAAQSRPLPQSCILLFELERLVYGLRSDNAIDQLDRSQLAAFAAIPDAKAPFDLVIDLAGGADLPACGRMLTPSFNGVPSEIGLIAALVIPPQKS